MRRTVCFGLLALALLSPAAAQKKPLDHSVYDSWKSIAGRTMSNDGKWLAYAINPQEGDGTAFIKRIDGATSDEIQIVRTAGLRFTTDSKFAVGTQIPGFIESRDARRARKSPADMPKSNLVIVNLTTKEVKIIEKVASFQMAEKDGGFLLYKPEVARPTPPPGAAPARPPMDEEEDQAATPAPAQPAANPDGKKAGHAAGEPYILLNLNSGQETKLEDIAAVVIHKDGKSAILTLSTKDGKGDGLHWLDIATGNRTPIVTQMGRYPRVIFDDKGTQAAFITDKDDYKSARPLNAVYHWKPGLKEPILIAKAGSTGLPEGWQIATGGQMSFSKSGKRLLFATQPKPAEDPKPVPDDEKVNLDIWHWQDKQLQPQQLLQAAAVRGRSYAAMAHLDNNNRLVQIGSADFQSVAVGGQGDASFALATANEKYAIGQSWGDDFDDLYVIDVKTGIRRLIGEKESVNAFMTPTGKRIVAIHAGRQEFWVIDPVSGSRRVISNGVPFSLFDELNDSPTDPSPYGLVGFSKDDEFLYVQDRYDIWRLDLAGSSAPVCVTMGEGRARKITYGYLSLDPEAEFIDPSKPCLFTAADERWKATGLWSGDLSGTKRPAKALWEDCAIGGFQKAKNSDRITFTKQTFEMFPDVWVSDMGFQNAKKVTDANPQQSQYWWGKAELVDWTSNDGDELQGIIVKPENFDPNKKYPMVVYFYERSSETLYNYRTPAPSASTINWSWFASNGYVVFCPDIPYKIGYPGESAMNAIMPGVQKVLEMGYVDPKKVGLQGQSWGGYQIAYMVTETNLFAAAFAGAPVGNMFSAYGGIRWGSGLVRQFQYEKTQSRIAGTMWDKPMRFYENSPVFFLDKVKTPLLIMSNDADGAVPWYQGIEIFTGLRRLQKPAWLLVYNGEDHNLVQRKNRKDLSIRMGQFFDHYLKGAPMPVWMSEGVPATEKGRTMGTEIKKPGA